MPVTGNFGHGEVREMSIDKKKQLSDRQLAVLERMTADYGIPKKTN